MAQAQQELSDILWHERDVLELLLFKLTTEQLLLTSGHTRYLHLASQEIAKVTDGLTELGLAQQVQAAAVARQWGAPQEATLTQLIDHAPPEGPWGQILTDHRDALVQVTSQIQRIRDANAEHLAALNRSAQETLAEAGSRTSGVYDAAGSVQTRRGQLFDTTL